MTIDARLLELRRGTGLGLISAVDDGIICAGCLSLAQEILGGESAGA